MSPPVIGAGKEVVHRIDRIGSSLRCQRKLGQIEAGGAAVGDDIDWVGRETIGGRDQTWMPSTTDSRAIGSAPATPGDSGSRLRGHPPESSPRARRRRP